MKNNLLTLSIALAFSATATMAQTPAKTSTTAKTITTTKTAPKLSEADKLMCDRNWQIVSVEEWGVVTKPPGEKNKTDMIKLTQDGKFELVMFSTRYMGTWTKSGQFIYFVETGTNKKFSFKVLSCDGTKFRVDHYSDEEGHSIFEYEAK